MNISMQFSAITSWFGMHRLQQAMRSGVTARVGGQAAGSPSPDTIPAAQRVPKEPSRDPYAHPYLGVNFDLTI